MNFEDSEKQVAERTGIPREFCWRIYHQYEEKSLTIEEYITRQNLTKLFVVSALVFFLNLVWLLYDLLTGQQMHISVGFTLWALQAMNVISVAVFAYALICQRHEGAKDTPCTRGVFLLYYCCVVAETLVLAISHEQRITAEGATVIYWGVALSSFLPLAFAFAPLPHKADTIAVIAVSVLSVLVPGLRAGKTASGLLSEIVLRMCFIIAYLGMYVLNRRYAASVTESIRNAVSVRYMAITDRLTGVLNRHALYDYMDSLAAGEWVEQVGIILLDVDHFKSYNDYYTHLEGDTVLIRISRLLEEAIKEKGLFLFRFGGEEFVILYPGASKDSLLNLATELHQRIWEENLPRRDIAAIDRVTATFGCALVINNERMLSGIVAAADYQMYLGKEDGRNCVAMDGHIYSLRRDEAEKAPAPAEDTNPAEALSAPERSYTALIVDDVEMNREILADTLGEGFTVIHASDGLEAIEQMEKNLDSLDVVLLDVIMPKMDGMDVLKIMRERQWSSNIPVLIISAESNPDIEKRCLEAGAADFIHKPFSNTLVRMRIFNSIERFLYRNHMEQTVNSQMEQLRESNRRLQQVNDNTIELLGSVVEARNLESGRHVHRVRAFTEILAECLRKNFPEYGLTPDSVRTIAASSVLHDVGKIMIKDEVLLKPAGLTDEEYEYMKSHTVLGCEVLANTRELYDEEYFQTGREICRYHHERFDGKGYPEGLAGNAIPISAQLVSVADCYDALVNDRCYRPAFSPEVSFRMVIEGKCGSFNPDIMKCLVLCRKDFELMAEKMKE